MKIFISYSHKDQETLDRLHTHLAVLKREGAVQTWYDREILAGDEIDDVIMQNLEDSDIFLAIISPDFLASTYCYEQEMDHAISRHESKDIRVIPVITEPCEWLATPLKKFKAVPKDGKPISEWKNANTAYLDIVTEIRNVVLNNQNQADRKPEAPQEESSKKLRYKVKKEFDDIDISDYRDRAFNEIYTYFEESIAEVNEIQEIKGRITRIDANSFTCSVLNMSLSRGAAHITVHSGSGSFMGDIYYSFSENAAKNTSNGGFNIISDDYELFLSSHSFMRGHEEEKFSSIQVAESLWNDFLEQAGVNCAA